MTNARGDWQRVDAALDELLALPETQRDAELARIARADPAFALELRSMVERLGGDDPLLDGTALEALAGSAAVDGNGPPELPPGTRIGPWRLVGLIGRGGMGEVYRAERADGEFEQDAAVKRMRVDVAPQPARFQAERQIIARLDHPGIARLLDGGVDQSNRPYMAMELVHGRHIDQWCRENEATLEQRLALFMEVCNAVAYAHRNLVVHRDIKPANVVVTDDGQPKLLDFGVARLLDVPAGRVTQEVALTPGYASPEQLSGGTITTAADVYALGLLLYELLIGAPAFAVQHLPLASAMQQVLTQPAPTPSRVARGATQPAIAARRIEGDLDAIVARALRKEPEQRYASVDALRDDVQRFLRHEAVHARRGSWAYVAGRLLRRHRGPAIAAAVAILALAGGIGAIAWEARIARAEAARATAVKDFLLRIFKASDPRIAADKPRGQVTARELLDVSATRIESDFARQPDLRIELMGLFGEIYQELQETDRSRQLQERRLTLANQYPGRYPQVEIELGLFEASRAMAVPDRPRARAALQHIDPLIRSAGLDESAMRADWWMLTGRAEDPAHFDDQRRDFERALALFERVAPRHVDKVHLLDEMCRIEVARTRYDEALRLCGLALAAAETADEQQEGNTIMLWTNVGATDVGLGRFDDGIAAFRKATEIAQRTYGPSSPYYWAAAGRYAQLLHLMGRRDEAMSVFEQMRRTLPDPPTTDAGFIALGMYARRLSAQGEAGRALPGLETDLRHTIGNPAAAHAQRLARWYLGDAYDQVGRTDDARRELQASWGAYVANEPARSEARLRATERWGRFLLQHGAPGEAQTLFAQVVEQDAGRGLAFTAMAQAGLAQVALAKGDHAAAVAAAADAMRRWAGVRGFRDVRMGAYIERVQAQALLADGQRDAARQAAQDSLAQSLRYDAPGAASIAEARALVARAG